ncbi:MAG: hypothetical protein Q7K54_04485 [Candidatus Parcubacteria bacterium]|nr:hypothetical protein [Candidatus Parcubacteria bacterium]
MLRDFVYFKTIKELKSEKFNWNNISNVGGVYIVVYKKLNRPEFLPVGSGGEFKGRDPNVSKNILLENWVDFKSGEDRILYIGKSVKLRRRIKSYIKFGEGRSVAKWGGRYIWQIANSGNLEIYWKEAKNPREEEKRMLYKFKDKHEQRLPFANLRM